ncbi:hypothetical protein [uncultured Variovorax sp.]|uniref:hypothetical protein n=1 Tax=uncultured Variovorax sp. TaxID=114708 RepID=UPI0025D491A5|nr:hypothetical protein [uncultured Variovorax sp.]
MSTRTIIEINHDFLGVLTRDPAHMQAVLNALKSSFITGMLNHGPVEQGGGITVLAQRHHSETLKLEVK